MLPVTLTIGLVNVNFLVDTLFASRLLDPELAPAAIDKAFRLYMLPQGIFAVAVTTVLFPTLARLAARGDDRRAPARARRRDPPDRVPARPGGPALDRARRADRPARLPARRVHRRGHGDRRAVPAGVLDRARLQRLDADPQPQLLRRADELDPDRDRARRGRAERRARRRLLPARDLGDPARDVDRERRRRGRPARDDAAPRSGSSTSAGRSASSLADRGRGRCRGGRGASSSGTGSTSCARTRVSLGQLVSLGAALRRGGARLPRRRPGARASRARGVATVASPARRAAPTSAEQAYGARPHPQLRDHRAHRPWQVDARGSHPRADRRGHRSARCASRSSTRWSSSASAASRSRRRPCACSGSGHELNLIDTPGHVDFTYEVSRSLQACEGALLVVDAAQGIEAQTLANAYLALDGRARDRPRREQDRPPAGRSRRRRARSSPSCSATSPSACSGSRRRPGSASPEVLDAIVERIPRAGRRARRAGARARLRLLVRPVPRRRRVRPRRRRAASRPREPLRAMAQGTDVRGRGARRDVACARRRSTSLAAGEVGYVITGLKDVSRLRVGDTLTSRRRPAAEPLPGYQDVKPMVFAGIFPTDSDDYPELRDALERLKLNDASLFYEPETSQALGFGFRCGFLGLLHMEIVRERLEREFDLDLLITAPNVAYRATTRTGEEVEVHNPAEMPRELEQVEEPYVKASVIVPKDYVGAVMELANERRGSFDHMEYLSEGRVLLVVRAAARRDRARLLRPAEVAHARVRELRLRPRGLPARRPVARGHPRRRRAGRRALADRPSRRGVRPRTSARRAAAQGDPAADVRRAGAGGDRLARDRARDDQGAAEGRAREVLRRRHHAQAEAAREAEEGQEADEAGRRGRGAAGGVPRRPQPRLGARSASDGRRPASLRPPAVLRAPVRLLRLRHRRRPPRRARARTSTRCSPSSSSSAASSPSDLETVFLGGGTPTFTEPRELARLLERAARPRRR